MKEDLWFNLTQALPIHSPANPAGLTAMNTPTMLGGGPVVSNGNITCQDRMAVMPVGVTIQPNGNYGTGNFKCMTLDDCICLGGPFPVFNTGDRVELCMSVQDPNYSCPQSNPPTPCAPPPMIPSCKYGTIDSRRGTVDLDAMHNGCPYLDNNCTPGSTQNYPDLPTVTNYGITWDDGTTSWDYKPTASTQPPLGIIPTPQPLISGCTDPTAVNYDPSATSDDGLCILYPHPMIRKPLPVAPPTPTTPVEVIETTKTTKTAGGGNSKLLMYLLVGGGLYYAFSQGMFKKLLK